MARDMMQELAISQIFDPDVETPDLSQLSQEELEQQLQVSCLFVNPKPYKPSLNYIESSKP